MTEDGHNTITAWGWCGASGLLLGPVSPYPRSPGCLGWQDWIWKFNASNISAATPRAPHTLDHTYHSQTFQLSCRPTRVSTYLISLRPGLATSTTIWTSCVWIYTVLLYVHIMMMIMVILWQSVAWSLDEDEQIYLRKICLLRRSTILIWVWNRFPFKFVTLGAWNFTFGLRLAGEIDLEKFNISIRVLPHWSFSVIYLFIFSQRYSSRRKSKSFSSASSHARLWLITSCLVTASLSDIWWMKPGRLCQVIFLINWHIISRLHERRVLIFC